MATTASARQSLRLVTRSPDGALRQVPLQAGLHVPAVAGAHYAIIDAETGAAPQGLVVKRSGNALVVEVPSQAGVESVEITGFYEQPNVAFVPEARLEGTALSGAEVTASTPELQVHGDAVVWQAAEQPQGVALGTGGTAALGALGVALVAAAAGGGGGGGASGGGAEPAVSAPHFTSSATATPVAEESGAGQAVYQATATATGAVTYALQAGGDAASFTIDANTGLVTLTGNPDFEAKSSYSFTVVATDSAGRATQQAVSLAIGNVDEIAPTITSGGTASALDENAGAGQVVYTVVADDSADVSGGLAYSLKAGGDAALFTIDANTGAVKLTGDPDFEGQSAYAFTVVATDAAGHVTEQAVTLAINDLDEVAPTITSGAVVAGISENSGAGQVVYTVTATDSADVSGGVTFSLKATGDAALFTIDATTGEVKLTGNPDYETQPTYAFTVVATDAAGHATEQALALAITNLDEVAPTITSGATAGAVDENSGAGQVVYTVTSDDSADASGGVTYALKAGGDAALFTINASTGKVTLTGNPDYEAKSGYAFTVVATDAAGHATEQAVGLAVNNLDEVAPSITSGATAAAIDENSGAAQVVYTATATDSGDVSGGLTYSLKAGGDAALFTMAADTGKVTLTGNPDYETKASYAFTVVATDAAGHATEQAVSLAITNLDEVAPTITSGALIASVNENSGAGQVVYTVTATDSADVSGGVTFSLKATGDAALFTIDANTGKVTLTGNPDYEAKASYAFTVVATDAAGHATEQALTLAITNLDEVAPTITSGGTAAAVDENSGAAQVVYTVTSNDSADASGGVTYALKPGGDAALFTIATSTGKVTLTGNPNYEGKAGYAFTVVATDAAGHATEQAVTLAINNLDEVAPTITSGPTAAAIAENSGAAQGVYTATSTDSADVSGGVTYGLKAGGDAALFTIDPTTGKVTLTGNPDYEAKASYAFTVVATDAAGHATEQAVTLAVGNLDEVAPTITSGATAAANENIGAAQVVYTATATDSGDVSGGVTYALKAVGDAALFTIDANNGKVTLTGNPDYEAKSAYAFTVVATDAAGHATEQAVTLAINNLDEVAPTITSGATAAAIAENSGAGQVVYTVSSTDAGDVSAGVTYALKAVGDASLFTINAGTGKVTLTGNPDYETKSAYAFTVVATDAAGHATEQAVSLAINDVADEIAPTVQAVALSSATGVLHNTLNAGDVVTVQVTMSEAVIVDTTGGTPTVTLQVGSSAVQASYVSGSGGTTLSFQYTVVAGNTDSNGIGIAANAFSANGGALHDPAGNAASLAHGAVADNAAYLVDTTAPTLTTTTPANHAPGVYTTDNLVLDFNETVYAGTGNIVISNGSDTRTISIADATQVTVSGTHVTVNPTANLVADTTYTVQMASGVVTDGAGNAHGGIAPGGFDFHAIPPPDTSIVVFDLLEGVDSSHSGRTFQAGVSYTIYVRVNSNNAAFSTDGVGPGLNDNWGVWSGAANLGADDRIVLVGSGSPVTGIGGGAVNSMTQGPTWIAWGPSVVTLQNYVSGGAVGAVWHFSAGGATLGYVQLWNGNWGANPNSNDSLGNAYLLNMPAGVLHTQGLA